MHHLCAITSKARLGVKFSIVKTTELIFHVITIMHESCHRCTICRVLGCELLSHVLGTLIPPHSLQYESGGLAIKTRVVISAIKPHAHTEYLQCIAQALEATHWKKCYHTVPTAYDYLGVY